METATQTEEATLRKLDDSTREQMLKAGLIKKIGSSNHTYIAANVEPWSTKWRKQDYNGMPQETRERIFAKALAPAGCNFYSKGLVEAEFDAMMSVTFPTIEVYEFDFYSNTDKKEPIESTSS